MKHVKHPFKTFPSFSELRLEDRDAYNKLISEYPPLSEISFGTLMTWWSSLGSCRVSLLNENLVISYWLPGDEGNSGLSLIGTNKIDESICEIFDYQREHDKDCRLVHVPDFTLSKINYPNMYDCQEEQVYTEPVIPVETSSKFEQVPEFIRTKIAAFMKATKGKAVQVRNLDLTDEKIQVLITKNYYKWKHKPHHIVINQLPKHAEDTFLLNVRNAKVLNQEAIGLYIDDELHSFTFMETPANPSYKILKYSGFSCEVPGLYEFACFRMAELFNSQGVRYVNMAIHIGDSRYTAHRLALNPSQSFRKYTVVPAKATISNQIVQKIGEKHA